VPVAHVEAGLRTGDLQSPLAGGIQPACHHRRDDLALRPTARAAFNLRRENVPETNIRVVGNTVVDALLYTRDRVASGYRLIEPALAALPTDKKLVLATTHRHENIGDPIRYVLRALRTLGEDGDKLVGLPVDLNPDVRKRPARRLSRLCTQRSSACEAPLRSSTCSGARRLRRGRDVSGVRRARARALHRPRCPSQGRRLGRRDARGRRHSRCVGQAGQAAT
jgi:UDP-N-acetylglucosamine 2-epimerase